MKKNIILILFCIMLLVPSCATSKLNTQKPQQQEVVSGENDPIMKLLLSGLIILSVNFLFTK
tara:strand:- start:1275 stop:1460 length:186 start_codon:yes stop_codon:yes gene_type:complete